MRLEDHLSDSGFTKGYDPRRYVQPKASNPTVTTPPAGSARAAAAAARVRPPITARRADRDAPVHPGVDPKEATRQALTHVQQRTPALMRRLLRLTEVIDRDAKVCLTCGRGGKREDELLLKAIGAALGIAGLAPGKSQIGTDGGGGPVLVFPAGTKMAVVAEAVDTGPRTMAEVVDGDVVRVTRADGVTMRDGREG